MSKFKRTDKKRPILINKKTKIFELFPSGVYGSGLKVKDFQSILKSSKKGNKLGGMMKYSEGGSPKLSDYTKNLISKSDQGIGRGISKTKSILASVKAKIAKASELMRKGPAAFSAQGATKFTGDTAPLSKFTVKSANRATKLPDRPGSKINIGKTKPGGVFTQLKKAGVRSTAAKALRVARLATPLGAATVVATSIKKRDPKAVKRERDFYKGKKYKDVGFESMMDYAKPKSKGGVISYNRGGFNYAINKKR
jgi:hypothetical protein